MIKLKHLMVAPLLAMFALMAPVGCSMESGVGAPGSDEATPETESTEESNLGAGESADLAAATPRWKLTTGDSCGEWYCGDCSCEPTARCRDKVPNNKPCSKRGDVCAKVSGNKVSISYFTCQ